MSSHHVGYELSSYICEAHDPPRCSHQGMFRNLSPLHSARLLALLHTAAGKDGFRPLLVKLRHT